MICFLFQKGPTKARDLNRPQTGEKPNKKHRPARKRRRCNGTALHNASQLNEHATKPSFAHAPAKIEQPPCQPEGSTQPTQNETISARQAARLGRTGVTRAGPSDMIKRGMFPTTKPNASLSHAMNQHDPQAPRAKSKHQC